MSECGVIARPTSVETKQNVDVALMFSGVKPSFSKLLVTPQKELISALEQISPLNISPKVENILSFARYVDLGDIRACIIGQDPYPDVNHAHGLCFSTRDVRLPASLKNIYECLVLHNHIPRDKPLPPGLLTSWAAAGVLMINMSLTTEIGKSNVHKHIWAPYMKKIITAIGALDQPIVYFLWGKEAQAIEPVLKNNGKSLVLKAEHPSPLSQARLPENFQFKHYTHFDDANSFLIERGRGMIDWNPANPHIAYISSGHFEQIDASVESKSSASEETHVLYTDGSSANNGVDVLIRKEFEKAGSPRPEDIEVLKISGERGILARAGYAVYFTAGPLKSLTLMGRVPPVHMKETDEIVFPSNIRGEGFAIVHALEHVERCVGTHVVEVVTDSKFWIEMIQKWIPGWVQKQSPFTDHKNPDLVERLWGVYLRLGREKNVTFRHVYSHGKDSSISMNDKTFNAKVDILASDARKAEHFFDSVSRS